jgi:predicted anti-sigma-YlaC factor YlaD
MKLFTSCKEAARAVAEALEHQLPFHRRVALAFHLLICSACRRYRRQVIGLNRLVRRYVRESTQPVAELDPATRQRFVESLRRAGGTPAAGTPATGIEGHPGGPPRGG